jgi:hypothetical protein
MASPNTLTDANHQLAAISIIGVHDPDGDAVDITVTGITQDESLHCEGDGGLCPDADGLGGPVAVVRAERDPAGDGRVYQITFRADDGRGGMCNGTVEVCVPVGAGGSCVDEGPLVDAACSDCIGICEESGACLADSCEQPTDALDTTTARFDSVRCGFQADIGGGVCTDVPTAVLRRFNRARALMDRVPIGARFRKAKRLVKGAVRNLTRAVQLVLRSQHMGRVNDACAQQLLEALVKDEDRAARWIDSL